MPGVAVVVDGGAQGAMAAMPSAIGRAPQGRGAVEGGGSLPECEQRQHEPGRRPRHPGVERGRARRPPAADAPTAPRSPSTSIWVPSVRSAVDHRVGVVGSRVPVSPPARWRARRRRGPGW
ncbi:MAG: hypothetical protein V9G12_21150 [Microthrixaceae bacterium]